MNATVTTRSRLLAVALLSLAVACGPAGEVQPEAAATAIDTPQGGTTAWVRQLGGRGYELVHDLATSPYGTTLLTVVGDTGPMGVPVDFGVVRLRPDRSVAWSRQFHGITDQTTWLSVGADRSGGVIVSFHFDCQVGQTCVDLGLGQASGSVLARFDRNGRLLWQRAIQADMGVSEVAVDPAGNSAVAVFRSDAGTASGTHVVAHDARGNRRFDVAVPFPAAFDVYPVVLAYDEAGNLAVGDWGSLTIASLDPRRGLARWTANLGEAGARGGIRAIGTTAKGTVVAVAGFAGGPIVWGGTRSASTSGTFVAVAEGDGRPRLGWEVGRGVGAAAVDPAGRLALLTAAGDDACGTRLERWNLVGERLWDRPLTTCTGYVFTSALGIDPRTHDVQAAGAIGGTVDFGRGPVVSRGDLDGYVLDVRP
jgi:hypothetical protein